MNIIKHKKPKTKHVATIVLEPQDVMDIVNNHFRCSHQFKRSRVRMETTPSTLPPVAIQVWEDDKP